MSHCSDVTSNGHYPLGTQKSIKIRFYFICAIWMHDYYHMT